MKLCHLAAQEPSSACRHLLPFRFAKRAKAIIIRAFARLPLGKWEKVPKGDEGPFSPKAKIRSGKGKFP